MGGWTPDQVQDLDTDVYAALVEWINAQASQADSDKDSIDMDAWIAAKKAADAYAR